MSAPGRVALHVDEGNVVASKPPATGVPSYWEATANPARSVPSLSGDRSVEVAIIGGGFTGLSAAYHLAKRHVEAMVLEANVPGWGASGRNGGMMVPRYKKGFAAIAGLYGHDQARRLHAALAEALETVENLVADCGIDCGFARAGHLTAAHSGAHLSSLRADVEWAAAEAGDRTPRILSRQEVAAEVGGGHAVGGLLDVRGAGMHPLNYTLGLAAALDGQGVPIFGNSPVLRLEERDGRVRLATPGGSVSARQVIIATNAYTDIQPFAPGGLAQSIVPVTTSIIATGPLGPEVRDKVMPARRLLSDTKRIMNWYRVMPDARLVFGGRGDITGRNDAVGAYARLERQLVETFPQLAGIGIGWRWSGKVAVTLDDFPHIARLSPQVAYAMGCGGRGVLLSNLLGKYLSAVVCDQRADLGPMSKPLSQVPFHAFRIPGMQIVASWYRFLDARETKAEATKHSV